MSSQSDECRFCRLALGEPRSSGTGDEAFLLSRQILAIASVGALVRGWTLVIPTEHTMSLAVLSSERRIELLQSVEGLRTSISAELGVGTVVFEHGASSECSPVSCTTAHAHVHVVPFDGDLLASLRGTCRCRAHGTCSRILMTLRRCKDETTCLLVLGHLSTQC